MHVTENALFDTSATPLVQITSNTSLTDANGNLVGVETASSAATDGIGPIISNAEYNGSSTVYVTLSENFSGSLSAGSFTFSGATATIASVSAVSGTNTAVLTLSGVSVITFGTSQLSLVANSVADASGNKQSSVVYSSITSSAVINEVMWSNTGSSASQYVELANFNASPTSLSGWTLAVNGTNIALNGSIAGSGFYLVAKNTPNTSGSLLSSGVTANLVSSSLSIITGITIQLKDSAGTVVDQAYISGNKGSNTLPASQERLASIGDGTLDASWYTAQANSGSFTATGPLGTPNAANIFDATPPTVSSSPTNAQLYATGA